MDENNEFSISEIIEGIINDNQKIIDYLNSKFKPLSLNIVSKDGGTIDDAKRLLDCKIKEITYKVKKVFKSKGKKDKSLKGDEDKLCEELFGNNSITLEKGWKTFRESEKIINGLKMNDSSVLIALYKEFMPIAKKNVIDNSGNEADAYDLLQDVFVELFEKILKGYCHPNIKAIIRIMIKSKWVDKLRKMKPTVTIDELNNLFSATSDSDEYRDENLPSNQIFDSNDFVKGTANSNNTSDFSTHLQANIHWSFQRIFNLLQTKLIQLVGNANLKDYLDLEDLSDDELKIIIVLLNEKKTSAACLKILLYTAILQIDENVLIAREMGYIKGNTKSVEDKGLDTLKSQKTRCIKRLKRNLN